MSFKYPLIHSSIFEFTRRVFKCRGISVKGVFKLLVYYLQLIPALPFEVLQKLLYGRQINKTIILKDPVFILGHYRSGTTYLQKLMVSDKRFGCLTNYDSLFPNTNLLLGKKMKPIIQFLLTKFKIKNPFFRNSIVQLSDPAEEDDYLMNKASSYSAYWGLIFPKCWRKWLNGSNQFMEQKYVHGWEKEYLKTLKYAAYKNKGKQLVLKSPPNTGRVRKLLQLFPKAKFIYIYRNPYHLYYSVKNMWWEAILKYYSLQNLSDEELDEIIFEHFSYLIGLYEKDKNRIPEGNLIEISYEALKVDSFKVLQKIYSKINLPDFDITTKDLMQQLEIEKDYKNFQYQFSAETIAKVNERWGKYISEWDYDPE